MAIIRSVDIHDQEVVAHLKLSPKEYKQLNQNTVDLLLLPSCATALKLELTTGKLGNGNRIMIPNRLLKEHNMSVMSKKVPAQVFDLDNDKFLLIKLKDSQPGVPIFPEVWLWNR